MGLKKKLWQAAGCIPGMPAGLQIGTGTSGRVFQPPALPTSLFLLLLRATAQGNFPLRTAWAFPVQGGNGAGASREPFGTRCHVLQLPSLLFAPFECL